MVMKCIISQKMILFKFNDNGRKRTCARLVEIPSHVLFYREYSRELRKRKIHWMLQQERNKRNNMVAAKMCRRGAKKESIQYVARKNV
jgi:hypothetical protein